MSGYSKLVKESDPIKYFDPKIGRKRCIKTYIYKCKCGVEFISRALPHKTTPSCGCVTKLIGERSITHGYKKNDNHHKLYSTWIGMKDRCNNTKNINYPDYGGRGIKVCEEWLNSFPNFLKDMGEKPEKGYSLDRKNVNGDYKPSNCRWTTQFEQNNNRRDNILITCKGETKTIGQWVKLTGIKKNTFIYRIKRGWEGEDIINRPVRPINRT